MFLLLFLSACPTAPDDSAVEDDCPQLDCQDQLELRILGVDGLPSDGFSGTLSPPDTGPIAFSCWDGAGEFEGGTCAPGGVVRLWTHAESYTLMVYEGDDAPWWSGTLTPTWTAPYDSEACGHYCWMAEETIQLLPCDGCG